MDENRDLDRVSLDGLDPEAALRALLAVDPNAPPVDDDQADQDDQDEPENEPQGNG